MRVLRDMVDQLWTLLGMFIAWVVLDGSELYVIGNESGSFTTASVSFTIATASLMAGDTITTWIYDPSGPTHYDYTITGVTTGPTSSYTFLVTGSGFTATNVAQSIRDSINNASWASSITASNIGATVTISNVDTGLVWNNNYIEITASGVSPTYAVFTGGFGDEDGPYDIEGYILTRPWDITTATRNSNYCNLNYSSSGGSATRNYTDLKFSDDGSKLYISVDNISITSSLLLQYSLGAPYDLTTIGATPTMATTSSTESQIEGLTFSPDGLNLFYVGDGQNRVYRHKLSSAWNITPVATRTSSSVINSIDPYSLAFNDDGTRIYLFGKKFGGAGGYINSYPLSAYDVTTISLAGVLTSSIDNIFGGTYSNNCVHGGFLYIDAREPRTFILDDNQNIIALDGPNRFGIDSTNLSKSVWPLDGALENGLYSVVGVLQNNNTYVSKSTSISNMDYSEVSNYENLNEFFPAPLYAMKGLSYSYFSNIAPTLPDSSKVNVYESSSLNKRFIRRISTSSTDYTYNSYTSVLLENQLYYNSTLWTAAHLRGKGPYLDSYTDFNETSKLKNKEYGLIPEFIVSDKVERYNQNTLRANLGFADSSYLSVTGAVIADSNVEEFFERYSHSNNIEIIKNVNDKISSTNNTFKKKIKLSFEGMKKFVPYNGFYPVQRTVDIANQFSSSYIAKSNFYSVANSENETPSSGSIYSPTYATGAYFTESPQYGLRSLITPLFAPGIMYNTIKSGLAVDFPIITSSMSAYSLYVNGDAVGNLTPLLLSDYDLRLPFEAIVSPEKYLKNIDIIDQMPPVGNGAESQWSQNLNVTSSILDKNNSFYSYMVNNFLAEVPNFFLENNKLSSLNSNIVVGSSIQITPQQLNKEYVAIVKIKKTFEESGNRENITRRALSIYSSSNTVVENILELQKEKYNYPRPQKIYDKETITLYSNPSAFGYACSNVGFEGGGSGEYWTNNTIDSISGFYPPYTPPYYDGEGWMILKYRPTTTGSFSLSDIINRTSASYLRYEIDQTPEIGYSDPTREQLFYSHNLINNYTGYVLESTGNLSLTLNGTTINDRLNKNSMQFSASAFIKVDKLLPNLDGPRFAQGSQLSLADRERLVISTKFETPILDFEYSRLINELSCTHNDVFYGTSNPSTTNNSPKNLGMWHQYGLLPRENSGIYLEIVDMPESYKKRGRQIGIVLTGSVFNVARQSSTTGSLIDLIGGFENTTTRVGEIAESKEIKEAVVAIPFTTVNNTKKYFRIKNEIVQNYKNGNIENISPTLLTQFNAMKEYIFPPQFDFFKKVSVEKIAMYVFEFTHTLSKQDLQDIWQNIMPELAEPNNWKIETKTIEHELSEDEIVSSIDDVDNIRWMVFKVKKRAASSYKEMVGKNFENKSAWIDTDIPEYTYNWPYDFFTMIENGKLTVSVEIEKDDSANTPNLSGQGLPQFPTGG